MQDKKKIWNHCQNIFIESVKFNFFPIFFQLINIKVYSLKFKVI